ncbi:uncharacterized protein YagA-like [Narcine bancroftii]|uniref:uncharacterized protein YagA-like n=1 Tax=Narcine bancroftii TaxID=1343680 RepID=UPI003831DC88
MRAPIQNFDLTEFQHIHVDLIGPLLVSKEARYLLMVVDRAARWPEAIPIKEASAETCARILVSQWITHFGVPVHITSDRGAQFTSAPRTLMVKLLGAKLYHTTPYYPQSNRFMERFHRHLKASL